MLKIKLFSKNGEKKITSRRNKDKFAEKTQ